MPFGVSASVSATTIVLIFDVNNYLGAFLNGLLVVLVDLLHDDIGGLGGESFYVLRCT